MFVLFVLKQGWACLFGGLLLGAILASHYLWSPDWPIHRYDALFIFALVTQALFLLCGLETRQEAMIILVFHLTGTAMEWFKVSAGSWAYPEPGFFKLMHVSLFSGFMYASVGSYMARVIRVFDMSFVPYPRFALSLTPALAIYANFFTHHFLPDLRWGLVLATLVLYGRCWIRYRIVGAHFWCLAAFVVGGDRQLSRLTLAMFGCFASEALKLVHSASLDALRKTAAGGFLLGHAFSWYDMAAYLAGIILMEFASATSRMKRRSRP
ncbi:DUF817 family protein [Asaia spathodeae]